MTWPNQSGNAARDLAREAFKNAGIPVILPDAFGFTDRIAQAEVDFRKGDHAPVHEEDIVRAINNFADSIGAPDWVHTTPSEVRRLRVQLLIAVPKLFANNQPPDAKRQYQLLRAKMGPIEATYLAMTMVFMKTVNSDYQFTEVERGQMSGKSQSDRLSIASQRTAYALAIVNGQSTSVSLRDVLAATDRLFEDLGMPNTVNSLLIEPASHSLVQKMGGF